MQRMVNIFHQESFTDISRSDSKLRICAILKREAGFENYLCEIRSVKERTALTKFRISNHSLMIRKGGHEVENYRPWRRENINFIELVNDNSYFSSKFVQINKTEAVFDGK